MMSDRSSRYAVRSPRSAGGGALWWVAGRQPTHFDHTVPAYRSPSAEGKGKRANATYVSPRTGAIVTPGSCAASGKRTSPGASAVSAWLWPPTRS